MGVNVIVNKKDLTSICQQYCKYTITDQVQEIPINGQLDFNSLRDEIFNLINKEKFGVNSVSLRLSKEQALLGNWADPKEHVNLHGRDIPGTVVVHKEWQTNESDVHQCTTWHPRIKDGLIPKIASRLEEISGFTVTKVRLVWLQPGSGYKIHFDSEPMRFHIPIVTNDFSYLLYGQTMLHMDYGKLYHLLTTDAHTAFNFGELPRLHLIFSTYINEEVEQELNVFEESMKYDTVRLGLEKINGLDQKGLYFLYKVVEQSMNEEDKPHLLTIIKNFVKNATE